MAKGIAHKVLMAVSPKYRMKQAVKRFMDAFLEDLAKGDECDGDYAKCKGLVLTGFTVSISYEDGLKEALENITKGVNDISEHYGAAVEIYSSKDRKYSAATNYESGAIIKVEEGGEK